MGFPNTHPAMLGRWSLHISRTLRATGCRGTVAFDASVFVSSSYFPMDIASWQQFSLSRLEPAQARVALAPWAMAISARVVGDGSRMSAAGAAVAMPVHPTPGRRYPVPHRSFPWAASETWGKFPPWLLSPRLLPLLPLPYQR